MTPTPKPKLILASQSPIRQALLKQANVDFVAMPARIDEDAIRESLLAEKTRPRQMADYLAETKANAVANRCEDVFVLGVDQIIAIDDKLLTKPETKTSLFEQMTAMSGRKLDIFSAAVIFESHRPVWRHIGVAQCFVKTMSEDYIRDYVEANFEDVRHSVGGFHIESHGIALFDRILGDYFSILGMPIIEILSYLRLRGVTK